MSLLKIVDLAGNDIVTFRPEQVSGSDPIACPQWDAGWPQPRESAQEAAGQSGDIDLTNFHGSRTITADLRLRTIEGVEGTKEENLDLLEALSAPRNRFYVYMRRDNWSSARRALVRTSALSRVFNRESAVIYTVSMSWKCPSGVLEAVDLETGTIIPASTEPLGLSFVPDGYTPDPIYPGWILWGEDGIAFSAGTSADEATITNDGNTDTPISFQIYGQVTNPVVTNVTTGQVMAFNTTVPTTQWLQITSPNIFMNNDPAQSFYSTVDWYRSSWIILAPGDNKITFSGANMNASTRLEMTYRPRWI